MPLLRRHIPPALKDRANPLPWSALTEHHRCRSGYFCVGQNLSAAAPGPLTSWQAYDIVSAKAYMRASDIDMAIPVPDAKLLGDLGHPTRLRIVEGLRDGEKNVSEIIHFLGDVAQARVSSHLA